MLRSTGFFSTTPVEMNGTKIRPIDFTSRLLFDEWKLGETEEELTVMRITIKVLMMKRTTNHRLSFA
ncbi:MAG: hypothetical protein R2847_08485 [Bacteroidia bacterium]